MNEKCDKYKELFINNDENVLIEHLKICPECKDEHEQMTKVVNLVKEVKPLFYKKKHNKMFLLKAAAGLTILITAFFAVNISLDNSIPDTGNDNLLSSLQETSIINEMGLPVDDYGLLYIE
jgi:hypothetical protein